MGGASLPDDDVGVGLFLDDNEDVDVEGEGLEGRAPLHNSDWVSISSSSSSSLKFISQISVELNFLLHFDTNLVMGSGFSLSPFSAGEPPIQFSGEHFIMLTIAERARRGGVLLIESPSHFFKCAVGLTNCGRGLVVARTLR